MGFYSSAQIVRDVREHGVEVRAPDINRSGWDVTLEPGPRAADRLHDLHRSMANDIRTTHAVRLGFREIKGLNEDDSRLIAAKRRTGYDSVRDVWLRTGLPPLTLERLADADAFRSLGLSRRDALWAAKALGRVGDRDDDLPLFVASPTTTSSLIAREPDVMLPPMPLGEEVVNDYRFLRLSLKAHPVQFLRDDLRKRGVMRNDLLRTTPSGAWVKISGLVTCRQRPGSAKGVVFLTIEDESAVANVIIWQKVFERVRPAVLGARLVTVSGVMQNEAGVIHVVAEQIEDLTNLLTRLAQDSQGLDRHGMPSLAADLDAAARGSAHTPNRRSG
jgi:error-prone DNA polymerase